MQYIYIYASPCFESRCFLSLATRRTTNPQRLTWHMAPCSLAGAFSTNTRMGKLTRLRWGTTLGICLVATVTLYTLHDATSLEIGPALQAVQLIVNYSKADVIFDDVAKPVALLQGCDMVYVDVGTNIGVQIRKLYEPALYPGAAVIPIFDQVFGINRSSVCAVGFEMNPAHTKRLKALQEHYTKTCGHRVHIFTETAASVRNESVQFWSDNAPENYEGGASIEYNWNIIKGAWSSIVQAVDLADFLIREVFPHASKVAMKLDIEGTESRVLPRLLLKGALCNIDTVFIEVHSPPMLPAAESPLINRIVQDFPHMARLAGCKTILSSLDDESFLHDAGNTLTTC